MTCKHEYERKGYRNGGGICKHCGTFDMVFEPLEHCVVCDAVTYWACGIDADGKEHWFCIQHSHLRDKVKLPSPYDEGLTLKQSMELLDRASAYRAKETN